MVKTGRLNPVQLFQIAGAAILIVWLATFLTTPILAAFGVIVPSIGIGQALLVYIIITGLVLLATVSFEFKNLRKEDFLYLFIILALLVAVYIILPIIQPDIFSAVKQGVFSIVG